MKQIVGLDLFPASLPGLDAGDNPRLDAGDEPLVRDMGRSLIDVRRFGGGSAANPGIFECHDCSFGEVGVARFAFPDEDAPLPTEPPDAGLDLRSVGVVDLMDGVEGLDVGVDGLTEGVRDRKVGLTLALGPGDALRLEKVFTLLEQDDGLDRRGLALLREALEVVSVLDALETRIG